MFSLGSKIKEELGLTLESSTGFQRGAMLDHFCPTRDDMEARVSLKVQDSLWVQVLYWLLHTSYCEFDIQRLHRTVINIYYLYLTFIWGTDSPVSMASSTMQRPLRSSTSQGTKLSWGDRPTVKKIHFFFYRVQ